MISLPTKVWTALIEDVKVDFADEPMAPCVAEDVREMESGAIGWGPLLDAYKYGLRQAACLRIAREQGAPVAARYREALKFALELRCYLVRKGGALRAL